MIKRFIITLVITLGVISTQADDYQTNVIPVPAVYIVHPGCVNGSRLSCQRKKVRISEKALLHYLGERKLADWQLKSAYWLEIGEKEVRIVAADEEGVFYACQTLKMMEALDSMVNCCTILDWPRLRYRGVMLDESRHLQGKEFVKKQLEMMALLKMNRFHFHLVDNPGWRLQIDAFPRLTQLAAWRPQAYFWDWEKNEIGGPFAEEGSPDAYGGYYTKKDIAEILAFAAKRHIEVIPEIELPGHNYETRTAYPWLSCSLPKGGKDPWELCPGKESTYDFLEKVLLEVFEMFPSEYIHIGGDEARKNNWKICPYCQMRMRAEKMKSVDGLQSYMIRRIGRFAHAHGKRIIGWDEILQGGADADATVMCWHGTEVGERAAKEGHDVIFTPTHSYYLDYHQDSAQFRPVGRCVSLQKVYSFEPVTSGIAAADTYHVLGVQGNLWTEHIQDAWHAEMMLYPRVYAIAETGWSLPEKKSWQDFFRRSAVLSSAARKWGYRVYGNEE